MKVVIDNNIRIENPIKEVIDYCKQNLEIDNPQFMQSQRLGFSTWRIPRRLYWYEKRDNDYVIPFGCLSDIYKIHPVKKDYIINLKTPKQIEYKSNIKLYDYQQEVVDVATKAKNGVIVMPAGSGKTQTALQIIATLGLKTLWLTHTKDLLTQSYNRAKDNFENIQLGKISEGKIDISPQITFATVQTMVKMDLTQYKNEFDCIVIDEAHRTCGTPAQLGMFYKVINSLSARYKYGITATPYRNIKGTEKALFSLVGPIIIDIPKEVVADRTIKAKIKRVDTGFTIENDCLKYDGTILYSTLNTKLAENKKRNDVILNILKQQKDHYTIVLGDRLSQLQYLKDKLGYGVMIDGKMTTKKGKELREKYIEDMRQGREKVIFSTFQLAKEGLDIPRLDRLLLVAPHKDRATIIQSVR